MDESLMSPFPNLSWKQPLGTRGRPLECSARCCQECLGLRALLPLWRGDCEAASTYKWGHLRKLQRSGETKI